MTASIRIAAKSDQPSCLQPFAQVAQIAQISDPFEIFVAEYAEVAIWCSLPPALSSVPIVPRHPRLHVHLRADAGSEKIVDRDFFHLSVSSSRSLPERVSLTPSSALSFLSDRKSHSQMSAMVERFPGTLRTSAPNRTLDLGQFPDCQYWIWASTPAVLWTAERQQECGIHVHLVRNGKMIVDETFGQVISEGRPLDREMLIRAMLENTRVENPTELSNAMVRQ